MKSDTTMHLNINCEDAYAIVLKALSQIKDIKEIFEEKAHWTIYATTKMNMKTYGDNICIHITKAAKGTNIAIESSTEGQIVDYGRNKDNICHIVDKIETIVKGNTISSKSNNIQNITQKSKKQINTSHTFNWQTIVFPILGLIMAIVLFVPKSCSNSSNAEQGFKDSGDVFDFVNGRTVDSPYGDIEFINGAVYYANGERLGPFAVESYTKDEATIWFFAVNTRTVKYRYKVERLTGYLYFVWEDE